MQNPAIQEAARRALLSKKSAPKPKGFNAVAEQIAKDQGVSIERARAILAAGTRRSSNAAKRINPALKNVPGA